MLTALGVVLGIATFVSVVGLAGTASGQITDRFDALVATSVTATDSGAQQGRAAALPADADNRARALNGVKSAGVTWFVNQPEAIVLSAGGTSTSPQITAASGGIWALAGPVLAQGKVYDNQADIHRLRVAVLGEAVARELGITTLATRPNVVVDGLPFSVIGIVESTQRLPELALSINVPRGTAQEIWGYASPSNPARIEVETNIGAARQVARELPYALASSSVDSFSVAEPPDPQSLRRGVGADLQTLFVLLAAVCLLVGSVGIANTTMVSVVERTPELGLRRALGATPRHIAMQVVVETSSIGAIGGLVGSAVGIAVTFAVALGRGWTVLLDPAYLVAAPVLGLLVGSAAGIYPAVKAAGIEPAEALRR